MQTNIIVFTVCQYAQPCNHVFNLFTKNVDLKRQNYYLNDGTKDKKEDNAFDKEGLNPDNKVTY